MLEAGQYLIGDWRSVGDDAFCRDILHAATHERLGRVHSPTAPERGWTRWLRSYRLELRETDDDSLLIVLKRPWRILRLWDIYDADDQRMGSVYPPSILDEDGVRRAFVDRGLSGRGRIISAEGRVLTELDYGVENELRVKFADDLEENPFLRMLLLASAIALDSLPAGA